MHSRELIKILKEAGYYFVRSSGSHHHFAHPSDPGRVITVPHPKHDLAKPLVKAILKQAGLK